MSTLRDRQNARDGLARDGLKVLAGGRQPLVAAVDIGASKIGCFIMKPDGANRDTRCINVTGVAHVRSAGVRGGSIINMDDAAHAIAQAVERAESMAGVNVGGVVVTTAGGQIASHRTSTTIQLSGRPISDHDLSRALQLAVAQARFLGRRPIHLLPIAWSVDGARGVRDPRNMFGRQLSLDLLVVTMNESAFQTLGHCLELVHLQFDGVVAAPFASALAALEDDEMDLGAVCIDMGGGSTSVAVFGDGSLLHVDSLAVGGSHVTADIARGLSTTTAGAERIKTLHGSAIASANEDRETIEAPPRGRRPRRRSRRRPPILAQGHHRPARRGDPGTGARAPESLRRPDRPRRLHRADRRGQPARGRARSRRARLRPPRPPRPPEAGSPPGRSRRRPRLLRRRRRPAPLRLRPP